MRRGLSILTLNPKLGTSRICEGMESSPTSMAPSQDMLEAALGSTNVGEHICSPCSEWNYYALLNDNVCRDGIMVTDMASLMSFVWNLPSF